MPVGTRRSEDVKVNGVFQCLSAVRNVRWIQSVSPARSVTGLPSIMKRIAPDKTNAICSLGCLCSGTDAPLRKKNRATVTFSVLMYWRPTSGLSCSVGNTDQSICIGDHDNRSLFLL